MVENNNISISRAPLSQATFAKQYGLPEAGSTFAPITTARKWARRTCSPQGLRQAALRTLPCVDILRKYKWRKWLAADLVSGLSVGVIQIPQGMGFALLAEVPAVYGLYASLWPVLFYFFFGTSRHISMGTTALISIMVASIVIQQMELVGLSNDMIKVREENGTLITEGDEVIQFKVGVAMSVSFLMGIFLILMSFLRLGVIATYMSMPFVRSFMTGAGINIMANQLPFLFQIKMPPMGTMLKTPRIVIEVCRNIMSTNVATLFTGVIAMAILYVIKEVVNTRYRDRLLVPIPAELIVFTLGTIISHFGDFSGRLGVHVIGSIPRGIPAPALPSMHNWSAYAIDCFIIAVVSFAISISMAKMMAKKHRYSIDTNQELLAYGLSYGLGALFLGFCGAQAPPRSVVQDIAGGRTQLASLVSCVLVLLFALAIGPFCVSLPNAVLAAIIFVALIPLMKSFTDLKTLWRSNKVDCLTWVITLLVVVFVDITYGLIAGMMFSVLAVTFQGLCARGADVTEVADTGLYIPVPKNSTTARRNPRVVVYSFSAPLYFYSVGAYRRGLYACTYDPSAMGKSALALLGMASGFLRTKEEDVETPAVLGGTVPEKRETAPGDTVLQESETADGDTFLQESEPAPGDAVPRKRETADGDTFPRKRETPPVGSVPLEKATPSGDTVPQKRVASPGGGARQLHTLVLDCGHVPDADTVGTGMFRDLRDDYRACGVRVVLAGCSPTLLARLSATGIYQGTGSDVIDVYPSVHDAVKSIRM